MYPKSITIKAESDTISLHGLINKRVIDADSIGNKILHKKEMGRPNPEESCKLA